MTADNPRLRLAVVAMVAVSLFAALFARLYYLQVLSAPDFRLQAQANSIRIVPEAAPRGRILDRHGRVLVDNRSSNVVAIDRAKLGAADRKALLARLATLLEVPADVLGRRLDDQRVSPYTPVPIAEDVPEEKMTRLLERADDFPAVVAKRVAVRSYPMGNLGAHVVGYVGEITQEELDASAGAYVLGDQIGKAGVERIYEKELRGRDGELKIEVDAKGKPIRVVSRRPPAQGYDVVLSLDADLQRTTEEALAQGLNVARGKLFQDNKKALIADAGAAVVLDTKGGVEAMASYPTFDLPGLADGISSEEAKVLFGQGSGAPFTNRAIQGQYAPGSTWKLVTADAALRTGLVNGNFSLVDNGTYTIPGDCTGRGCLRHNSGTRAYGRVGVSRALTVSSDVFFYTLGANFWIQRQKYGETPIQDAADRFGFGADTGVPLPFESKGRVLTPASKQALHDKNPRLAAAGWYTGNNVNLAIGQEAMLVTPIQIANAYATFANGGSRYQPNIALRIQRQDKSLVREITPRLAAHVDLPPSVRNPIMSGLQGVVSDPKGTAYAAFAGFPLGQWGVAGKTGTAQATPKQDTALFSAFGPTADPQHVVTVVMEQSGFGASSAAPVARRIFEQLAGIGAAAPVQFIPSNGGGD
ncbi:MAG: penicillin-binding protein 2 [Actinomycetota bacterium]|nr:penicillin-binding protein 2 [Actinomycetota bacterium]